MLPLVFYIWKSYLFFANDYEVITAICIYFILKLSVYVYIYKKPMCMKRSVNNLKYLTFVSQICSFTSMVPYAFHVWQSYLVFANGFLLQFMNISHLAPIFVLNAM